MSGRAFFDSNVLIYTLADNDPREAVAARLLAAGGTISVQVLNEFTDVARRKLRLSWSDLGRALWGIRALCPRPLPITLGTHEAALRLAAGLGYRFYDSLVIASALEAGCGTLYSEAMQDGQVVDGTLTIQNPFKP